MGDRYGDFVLQEKIGAGGVGDVYRARHVGSRKTVALKVLAPNHLSNERLVRRFERELSILRKLRHPHVVHCYTGSAQGPQPYYAMELVTGGSLSTLLRLRGKLEWSEVVEFGLQICSALDYANQHGIIHRDLKPPNLLLTEGGSLKLGDFGLATEESVDPLTVKGRTVGTFAYMSPEQVRGRPRVSHQSDLYAMGCVMFEMLAGRPPFDADTPEAILALHVNQQPPRVSSVTMNCPARLDKLIDQLLAKEPHLRPKNAQVVTQALLDIRAEEDDESDSGLFVDLEKQAVLKPVEIRTRFKPRRPEIAWTVSLLFLGLVCSVIALWPDSGSSSRPAASMIQRIQTGSTAERLAAIRALAALGPQAVGATPEMTELLGDSESVIRAESASALKSFGGGASSAIPALVQAKNRDPSDQVRAQAGLAIETIQGQPVETSTWRRVLLVLGLILPVPGALIWAIRHAAAAAVPGLIKKLSSAEEESRLRAASRLGLIGSRAAPALQPLLESLKDSSQSVRSEADRALGRIGVPAGDSLAALATYARFGDELSKLRAIILLGYQRSTSPISILTQALQDPNDRVRIEAIDSLGRIGRDALPAVSHLIKAKRDKAYSIRQAVDGALRKIQPEGIRTRNLK